MQQRQLGSSGLKVSAVGLGTNNFGRRLDYSSTELVIKESLNHGINFIDTANIYSLGQSEEFIGKAIQSVREEIVLATKGGGKMESGPNGRGNSKKHLLKEIDASLKRLQVEYIDLYQVHFPDPETPILETLSALDYAVKQGKIRYIGCSNFLGWQIAEALSISKEYGLESFISTQPEYNLTNRKIETEVIPAAINYNIGIIPYYPLASGILTGKYSSITDLPEGTRIAGMPEGPYKDKFLNERNFEILNALQPYAKSTGHTISELSIAWLLAQPQVSSVITGATKPEQIEANGKAAEWDLSESELEEIENLIVGI